MKLSLRGRTKSLALLTATCAAGALTAPMAARAATPSAATPGYRTTLSSSTSIDSSGTVHASLHCAVHGGGAHQAGCRVTVLLSVIETLHHGKVVAIAAAAADGRVARPRLSGQEIVVLAKRTLVVPAARTRRVTLTLDHTGRALLTSRGTLRVRYAVLLGSSGQTKVITFRA